MFAVGQSYQRGIGTAHDYKKAMVWYRRAARAGSAEAMNSIGVMYENGLGVWKSRGKAIRWYERAAQAGSNLAKGNLAQLGRD
jgi:TPR repeat protein